MRNSQVFAKVSFVLIVAALAVAGATPNSALALPIVSHSGQTDPTTEGWTSTGALNGNAINDGGVDAWQMNDTSGSDSVSYERLLTAPELSDVAAKGWSLDANYKVEYTSHDTGIDFEYGGAVGSGFSYLFSPGLSGGDQSFVLNGTSSLGGSGSRYTLTGSGLSFQHYKIVYDPLAAAASIYVNDALAVTGWTPGVYNDPGLSIWTGSWKTGDIRIASLAFSSTEIPEPGTLMLLTTGLLGLLAYAWRKRR